MDIIKVLIVDDHQLIRMGVSAMLSSDEGIKVVGEAESGQNLIHVVQETRPNVILMDISLDENINGIELTSEITSLFRKVKVIMLSMHISEDYIQKSIQAGAVGYLLKDSAREELIKAVKNVSNNETYFSKEVHQLMIKSYVNKVGKNKKSIDSSSNLTKREVQIIELIADGLNNYKIAEILEISNRTVDTHRTNILKKTGVKNVAELVKYAIVNKVIVV